MVTRTLAVATDSMVTRRVSAALFSGERPWMAFMARSLALARAQASANDSQLFIPPRPGEGVEPGLVPGETGGEVWARMLSQRFERDFPTLAATRPVPP